MSKQDKGTGNVRQLHSDKPTKIEPLDGWEVQTKYGTLRLRDGTDCVRLQDVHSWFLRAGMPANEVAPKMFGALLDAAGDACDGALDAADELAACKLLGSLRLVCADERPVQIFAGRGHCKWGTEPAQCENMQLIKARRLFSVGDFEDTWIERYVPLLTFMPSDHVKAFRLNFPALGHHRLEDGTPAGLIYGMAEGVRRVWHGAAVAATDPVFVASIQKDRAEEAEYRIEWPSDEVLSLALERVAVPIAIAHELWGWGREVTEQDQATEQAEHVAGIKTWQDAADQHKSQSDGGKKPKWTHEKLAPIAKAISSGVKAAEIAQRAGVTRQTLEEVLNKYKADPTKYGAADPLRDARTSGTAGGVALQAAWAGKKPA